MKNFTGFLLILAAFAVSACSSVVEEPQASESPVTLTIEIVGVPDNEHIGNVLVIDEDDSLAVNDTYIDDLSPEYELQAGYYTVRVHAFTKHGYIVVLRDVILSTEERLVIDASSRLDGREVENSPEDQFVWSLEFPMVLEDTMGIPDLYFGEALLELDPSHRYFLENFEVSENLDARTFENRVGSTMWHFAAQESTEVLAQRGAITWEFDRTYTGVCGHAAELQSVVWETPDKTTRVHEFMILRESPDDLDCDN